MIRDYTGAVRKDEGQGVVEYSLIVGTVSVVLIAAFITLGLEGAVTDLATDITTALNTRDSAGID
jgi:Flp pilus assembly pilin Flp